MPVSPPLRSQPTARLPRPSTAFVLPTEPTSPSASLGDYSILLYGEKKIGKTSLAARFPNAFFAFFEPGGKGLEIYQAEMKTWESFVAAIDALEKNDTFSTVVVDTIDLAYKSCFDYVCREGNFSHPNDMNDYGKSWKKITDEFQRQMLRLAATGKGIIWLSHAQVGEFQEPSGLAYNKIIPTMDKKAREFISGFADAIFYYGYYGDERMLTVEGSDTVEAGQRMERQFRLSGDPSIKVHSVPMGTSADEGYANLLKAFANGQSDRGEPKRRTGLSDTPKTAARR